MEVLVALTVFLLALVVLGRLVIFGSDRALDAQHQIEAADLCQTKLAEVIAGAIPLTSQSDVPFEEDAHWRWSLDCENTNYPGLWKVTVRVTRQQPHGIRNCLLTQMVLDPQLHGSLQDVPPDNGTGSNSSTTGNSPSRASKPSGSTGSTGGGS
jgi:hypothetical protein